MKQQLYLNPVNGSIDLCGKQTKTKDLQRRRFMRQKGDLAFVEILNHVLLTLIMVFYKEE